jgi:hypothetical protein
MNKVDIKQIEKEESIFDIHDDLDFEKILNTNNLVLSPNDAIYMHNDLINSVVHEKIEKMGYCDKIIIENTDTIIDTIDTIGFSDKLKKTT